MRLPRASDQIPCAHNAISKSIFFSLINRLRAALRNLSLLACFLVSDAWWLATYLLAELTFQNVFLSHSQPHSEVDWILTRWLNGHSDDAKGSTPSCCENCSEFLNFSTDRLYGSFDTLSIHEKPSRRLQCLNIFGMNSKSICGLKALKQRLAKNLNRNGLSETWWYIITNHNL